MSKPENPKLVDARPGDQSVFSDITLRDLFAGMALAGAEANPSLDRTFESSARIAYEMADHMLAERERREGE